MRLCENRSLNSRGGTHTLAQHESALSDLVEALRTAESGQLVNRLLAGAWQALIDCEAATVIGAAPHERTETRTTQRTDCRPRHGRAGWSVHVRGGPDLRPARRRGSGLRRPTAHWAFAYLFAEATYCKVRVEGRWSARPSSWPPGCPR